MYPNERQNNYKAALALLSDSNTIGLMGFDNNCSQIIRTAQSFNTFAVSISCDYFPTDEPTHDSFLQFNPGLSAKIKALISFLKAMRWNNVVLISLIASDGADHLNERSMTLTTLQSNGINVADTAHIIDNVGQMQVRAMVKAVMNTYLKTRIYVLLDFTSMSALTKLLLDTMSRFGILETGEYFAIGIAQDTDIDSWYLSYPEMYFGVPSYTSGLRSVPSMLFLEEWRSYAFIAEPPPVRDESQEWETFVQEIYEAYSDPPCPPLCSYSGKAFANVEYKYLSYWKTVARVYDAMLLISSEYDKASKKNIDLTNGTFIKQLMQDRSIKSITGRQILINEQGYAEIEQKLIVPREMPTCQTCTRLKKGLFSIARIIPGKNQQYAFQWLNDTTSGSYLQFIGGKAPLGSPKCGFKGELCSTKTSNSKFIIAGAVTIFTIAVIAIIIIVYKQIQYERNLDTMAWKIPSSEIDIKNVQARSSIFNSSIYSTDGDNEQGGSKGVSLKAYQNSLNDTEASSTKGKMFKKRTVKKAFGDSKNDEWSNIEKWALGKYKKELVAVKKLCPTDFKLVRDIKKEITQLTKMRNEFLNNIVGLVHEPPKLFLITRYAPRNSLKDMLENPDMRLENMFIVSFVTDIIKGLRFLHQSPLGFHGNLKSSNCFVDATWRVVLGNYGMVKLRENEPCENDSDLLWTAPEILRSGNRKVTMTKTELEKGDIYSFGIILYEIYGRNGPYNNDITPYRDIVEKVKFPKKNTYMRPDLAGIEKAPSAVKHTCESCWNENPDERPKIKRARDMLVPITEGLRSNIADNIMALLDRYKNNLEDVVKERTAALEEEQMRTERLILQLLP
uniref:guanylate cyclase n=1 Tax=Plectus sambesii TaxID=2011161 RepID=A0A914V749_9BILA